MRKSEMTIARQSEVRRFGAGLTLESLIKEAEQANQAGDMVSLAERCRRIAGFALEIENEPLAAESFYAGCLAYLKSENFDQARELCREARLGLGEYLDLTYFEFLIEAAAGVIDNVPVLAEKYLRLRAGDEHPSKTKTSGAAGEVLLMWGQALEELHSPASAMDIYRRYLELFPVDGAIRHRLGEMSGQSEKTTR